MTALGTRLAALAILLVLLSLATLSAIFGGRKWRKRALDYLGRALDPTE